MRIWYKRMPTNDYQSGNMNFFFELLRPSCRHHEARIRPIVNTRGTKFVEQNKPNAIFVLVKDFYFKFVTLCF